MPRASFITIGCKLNTYESETLQHQFANFGWDIVEFGEPADVTVVNTCTVTERSDADCRKIIRRARRANGDGLVVVTGCMAERTPDGIAAMPEVDLVVGNGGKTALVGHVLDRRTGARADRIVLDGARPEAPAFLTIAPAGKVAESAAEHSLTRATLQVQDGCDEHCTYCIIPTVRGPSRSRPIAECVAHARALAASSYREVALTGVNTGTWGDDTGDGSLADVVRALIDIPGIARVRLNSIEPTSITPDLVELAATSRAVCRHFHVPLQSGSDAVLRRMGRRYRTADYARIVETFAARVPGCAIGADVMVGFPGETDEQFAETLAFIAGLPLTYLHVFSYSVREGTPAERLRDHLPRAVKDHRSRELRKLGLAKRIAFHAAHVGQVVAVLVEATREPDGRQRGLTDNYIRVRIDGADGDMTNEIVPVRLTSADADGADGALGEEPR